MPAFLATIAKRAVSAATGLFKKTGKDLVSGGAQAINSKLTSFQDSSLQSLGIKQRPKNPEEEEELRRQNTQFTDQATKTVSQLIKLLGKITGIPVDKITPDMLAAGAIIVTLLLLTNISALFAMLGISSLPPNIQQ